MPCAAVPPPFVGRDPKILEVLDIVAQVADTSATVLITGESGTGKELVARSLHGQSARRAAPFLAINCGAIVGSLLESELFGHAKGAFTGADAAHVGKFEAAHGGTIFLDEIPEMSQALQVQMLRILQSGEYSRVGEAHTRHCDVRILAATNQDLLPLVQSGKFRKDLYYRLNIIRLELPPLRERRGDIPLFVEHFVRLFGESADQHGLTVSEAALDLLWKYDYPGNVRELENIIRRAVILCRDRAIAPEHLTAEVLSGRAHVPEWRPSGPSLVGFRAAKAMVVREFEKAYLTAALLECGGIVSRAARRTQLSERNFHAKLKAYRIDFMCYRR